MPSVTSRSGTTQQAEASPAPINAPMAAQLARFDSRLSVRVGRPDSGAEAMPQILSSDFVIRSVMSVVRTDSREFFMQPQSGILRAQLARKTGCNLETIRSEEQTSELQSLMRISN